ncbi:MAG: class I SAM-dependent methyltransferase [Saprospiraceae bacterium]
MLRDRRPYYAFEQIARLRRHLRRQTVHIPTEDHGAGSLIAPGRSERRLGHLVRGSAVGKRTGEQLFRLAAWLRPTTSLELGTNAGLSSLYLHLPDRRTDLHTIEGNPYLAAVARDNFSRLRAGANLHQHVGTFSEVLDYLLPTIERLDLVFIDGDHRHAPTVEYVRRCLTRSGSDTVIVLSDIHWTAEMEAAWAEVRRLPGITASLELWQHGLLFLRPEFREPVHLALVPFWWKPWRMGFFG